MGKLNQAVEDFEFTPQQMGLTDTIYSSLLARDEDYEEIKEIQPIETVMSNRLIADVDKKNKDNQTSTESKKVLEDIQKNIKSEKKKSSQTRNKKEQKQANTEVSQIIQNATNIEVPEDVDAIEVAEALIVKDELKLDNNEISVEKTSEKTPSGFWRPSVIVDPSELPSKVHKLSKEVVKITSGKIKPRMTDLRVINNTNKTQLKNSMLKLSGKCVTYKPKQNEMETKKGTRVIVSVPDTGNSWFIYLSDGRDHRIHEIKDAENHTNWLAKRILDFFEIGIEMTSWKIRLREIDSPMMDITDKILATGEYHAKPFFTKEDDKISHVIFYKKDTKNSWLRIALICKYPHYLVEGFTASSRPKESAYFDVHLTQDYNKNQYSLDDVNKYLLPALNNCFDKPENEWYDAMGLGVDAISANPKLLLSKLGIMKGKLSFKPLKNTFDEIIDFMEDEIDNGRKVGIYITDVIEKERLLKASQAQYKKSKMNGDLIGECIVGGTDKVEFVLTYMLLFLNQADKRSSSKFITSEKYYEMTGVKDTRPSELRSMSLAGKGQDRNYNTGDYVFMLEYTSKLNGNKDKFIAKTFDEILSKTMFLTDSPKFGLQSEYDKYL